ncbi:MAG TPA: hypothetical protein VH230_01430 [Stellaceae bacterium]|nr:hypothetical protein [Stellaceae bacterium]
MPQTDAAVWYQLYFQEPGVAEAEFDRNVRTAFCSGRINVSGDAPPRPQPFGMVPLQGGLFAHVPPVPPPLPAWLTEADIDYYTSEFTRTGFRGGLNWYRNIDRNWELLAPFDGVQTAGALYRRRPRSCRQIPRHGSAHRRLTEVGAATPRDDHGARLRPHHPGGAAGRGQRRNDRVHSAPILNGSFQ